MLNWITIDVDTLRRTQVDRECRCRFVDACTMCVLERLVWASGSQPNVVLTLCES